MLKVLFAGGGTAGHINPALAIAGYVKERQPDAEILYIGCKGGMEERLVPQAGFNFKGITVQGFRRKVSFKALKENIVTVKKAITAGKDAKKIIEEFQPDICIGTGGYVSGPVLRAAAKLGIPTMIHEQNAYPGVTNKMLSKHADRVLLAMPDARQHFKGHCRFVDTGNPVRGEILVQEKAAARRQLGLDERPVILSFGGSLGARKINESLADVIARSAQDGRYQHIHAYGQYGKWFPDLLKEKGADLEKATNLDIREYINDMPVCLAAADLVIARAGAITLSEIQVKGKPSILIPSPNVAENHQYHNAMSLVKQEAAVMIEEKDLTPEKLTEEIDKLASDPQRLAAYAENAQRMAIADAAKRIYSVMIEVLSAQKSQKA
ncbi:MAG: undecaprenyldiphospho-muramoylpentapeptide beta-N-acetylglucosaminyltransferase [Acutalibacteraceae bacterium]|nr:undecaprenyldiphospho-muramoylpentapeptide beta-N-acetylglucosaminyltransferase [Acutalibacteraceae bacterium]